MSSRCAACQKRLAPAIEIAGTKWKCPGCEIWVDFPKTTLCAYCLEEKDKCQECGGIRYHIGDCSKLKKVAAKGPTAAKQSEWPCIVCGGVTSHVRVGGRIICDKIKALEEFPCSDCGGLRKHWTPCAKDPNQGQAPVEKCDLTIAERIVLAETRIMGFRVH